jgi:hypothetical protein
MKNFIFALAAVAVLASGAVQADNQTDCMRRFAFKTQLEDGNWEFITLEELDNYVSLDMKLNREYRLAINYRLNESKPWSPEPKHRNGKASVIVNGRSSGAFVQRGNNPHILVVKPTSLRGTITLNARTGGIPNRGTTDLPSGNASCTNVTVPFRAYPPAPKYLLAFRDSYRRGHYTRVAGDFSNFRYSSVGNDRISSLVIPRGCEAVLWEHKDFRGRNVRFTAYERDLLVDDLDRHDFNDKTSSVQFFCRD